MARTDFTHRDFRHWTSLCRSMFPTNAPVRVRRQPMKSDSGHMAAFYEGEPPDCRPLQYIVVICSNLDRQATQDTLLHEWAHILHGEDSGDYVDHTDAFWVKHGELYRAW